MNSTAPHSKSSNACVRAICIERTKHHSLCYCPLNRKASCGIFYGEPYGPLDNVSSCYKRIISRKYWDIYFFMKLCFYKPHFVEIKVDRLQHYK